MLGFSREIEPIVCLHVCMYVCVCVCVCTQKDRYLTARVIMEAESPKSADSRLENQEERVGVSVESEGRKKIHT